MSQNFLTKFQLIRVEIAIPTSKFVLSWFFLKKTFYTSLRSQFSSEWLKFCEMSLWYRTKIRYFQSKIQKPKVEFVEADIMTYTWLSEKLSLQNPLKMGSKMLWYSYASIVCTCMYVPGLELRREWPRVRSPNKGDFENMGHWTNFEKIAYLEWFFGLFSSFYALSCNKIFNFHKIRQIFTKYRNVSTFSAPKMVHLTQFFPKIFKKFHFWASSAPKNGSLNGQSHLLFWSVIPSYSSPCMYPYQRGVDQI